MGNNGIYKICSLVSGIRYVSQDWEKRVVDLSQIIKGKGEVVGADCLMK